MIYRPVTLSVNIIYKQFIFILEPPLKFVNKGASNNISAYENESVTLCAIVNRERANVRWLKDGQLLNEDNIHISSEGNTHKLTINPLQLSDSGEYVCDANTDKMYFSLSVKGKNLALLSDLKFKVNICTSITEYTSLELNFMYLTG